MKRIIFLAICGGLLFAGCRKKSAVEICWGATYYDSTYTNVAALKQHLTVNGPIRICGETQENMDAYAKVKGYVDTVSWDSDTELVKVQYVTVAPW